MRWKGAIAFKQWQHLKRSPWQLIIWGLIVVTGLLVVLTATEFSLAKPPNVLTARQIHPLPVTLNQWQDLTNSGDYFEQVKLTEVGYLVWSQFPVKVYIETTQLRASLQAIAAVQEWNIYLPLQIVEKPETSDIRIVFKTLPLGTTNSLRARSALTRYELYTDRVSASIPLLAHRCTISPASILKLPPFTN